jgi:hypothetical protein
MQDQSLAPFPDAPATPKYHQTECFSKSFRLSQPKEPELYRLFSKPPWIDKLTIFLDTRCSLSVGPSADSACLRRSKVLLDPSPATIFWRWICSAYYHTLRKITHKYCIIKQQQSHMGMQAPGIPNTEKQFAEPHHGQQRGDI